MSTTYSLTDRGYMDNRLDSFVVGIPDSIKTLFAVPKKMVPLDSVSHVYDPAVTISASFVLDSIQNPRMTYENEIDNKIEQGYHIDSIDVEVYYQGFPIKIDYVRIEGQTSRDLHRGMKDSIIKDWFQRSIDTIYAYRPNIKVWRVSPCTEYRMRWAWSIRYFSKLFNGYVNSVYVNEYPSHAAHLIHSKEFWDFGFTWQKDCLTAVPWISRIGYDSLACFNYLGNYYCSTKPAILGYANGRRAWNELGGIMGDTTASFYETFINKWNWSTDHWETNEYFSRAAIRSLDTMSIVRYLDTLKFQRGLVTANEVRSQQYANTFGEDVVLYGEKPWWSQKQFHVQYHPLYYNVGGFHWDPLGPHMNIGYMAATTGEESRYMLWADIIRGCKGIMVDNGGFKAFDGSEAKLSLRRTGGLGLHYDPNSVWDTNYWIRGDSSLMDSYMTAGRIVSLWGNSDSDRVYLGLRSTRNEVRSAFQFMQRNSAEIMRLRLVSFLSKGYKRLYSGDTNKLKNAINLCIDSIHTRPVARVDSSGSPFYEPRDSSFYDITLLRDSSDHNKNLDSVFYIGICNRRTDPLRYIHLPISDTGLPNNLLFLSAAEYVDSCSVSLDSIAWRSKKYTQLGAREITIPFNYQPQGIDRQGRLLHVVEMKTDSMQQSIDVVICGNCPLSVKCLPGEGKLFRVTVLKPIDKDVANGSLEFSNQRKMIAMPYMKDKNLVAHTGIYDSSQVLYHVVYHRYDTVDGKMRVYYKRSKLITRCSPEDLIDPSVPGLWDTTICLSKSVKEYLLGCGADSIRTGFDCMYPSIVVRYDSADNEEYVYVVYTCDDPHPPSLLTSLIVESQFVSHDSIPNISSIVVERFGPDSISKYGHATVNASRTRNFYAWSTSRNGIRIASRRPSISDTSRCPANFTNWSFGQVAWDTVRGAGSRGADCRHPSLNTYSRLGNEDSCALVWEEAFLHPGDSASYPYDNFHVYYTQLRMRAGMISFGLPPKKEPNLGVLDTNTSGTIMRISRFITDREGFKEHHLPNVVRDLTISGSTWMADLIVWAGQGDSLHTCGTLPWVTHGIFMFPVWTDVDSLHCAGNHSVWSCQIGLNNPTLTFSTSFTHDSDIVFNYDAPRDSTWGLYDDAVFHFAKHYWGFTSPEIEIDGARRPHLSASPFIAGNVQWKQTRRIYNEPSSSQNPPIVSSARAMFKRPDEKAIASYPLLGYENADGRFAVCDEIVDEGTHTMKETLYGDRVKVAGDTIVSDWFRVTDKRRLNFMLNGEYTNVVQMYLENDRTGVVSYVDLNQIVVDSSNVIRLGSFDVMNGGGDDYRVLLIKNADDATFVHDVYMGAPLNSAAKRFETEKKLYQVDLARSAGLGTDKLMAVYPNPTEDGVFIAIAPIPREFAFGSKKLTVLVSDQLGVEVFRTESNGGETIRLATDEFANGVYNVQVISPNFDAQNTMRSSSSRFVLRR